MSVFKPLLQIAIAASIINELDKKNDMQPIVTEFTFKNRSERKTQLELCEDQCKTLVQKNKNLIKHIKELENIIEAHLIGWCIVGIIIFLIFIVNIAT